MKKKKRKKYLNTLLSRARWYSHYGNNLNIQDTTKAVFDFKRSGYTFKGDNLSKLILSLSEMRSSLNLLPLGAKAFLIRQTPSDGEGISVQKGKQKVTKIISLVQNDRQSTK